MNKRQKIIVGVFLIVIAFLIFFPPISASHHGKTLNVGRSFLFAWDGFYEINIQKLFLEISGTAALGIALILLAGLMNKKERG
jgi:hypothetical protein